MNTQAKVVLWLGLAMIGFQVFKNWTTIKAVVFSNVPVGGAAPAAPVQPPPLLQPIIPGVL